MCSVDDQVHLGFVNRDANPTRELLIGAQAQQGTLDLAGSVSAIGEVKMFNGIAQDQAGTL